MGQQVKLLVFVSIVAVALGTAAFPLLQSSFSKRPIVENFSLPDLNGTQTSLYDFGAADSIVLYSHGIGCPVVRQGVAKLASVKSKHPGVVILMINANPQDSIKDLRQELIELDSSLMTLKDDRQEIIRRLGIQRTGHVIVINPKSWTLEYSGALDGERLGQERSSEQNFLEDALTDLASGQSPRISESAVTGCVIGS